jgi:hypothetical protein
MRSNEVSKRRNYLKKVLQLQADYKAIKVHGAPDAHIWRTVLGDKFFISYGTMLKWLKIPAQKRLRELDENRKQAELF